MVRRPIIMVGGGGHCRSCIDVIETTQAYTIQGIVDLPEKCGKSVLGYDVIAADEDLPSLVTEEMAFLVTLGQIKDPAPRKRLFDTLHRLKARLPAIVSPLAYVSRHAFVGAGTIVMHGAVVNAGARVGDNCIVNTRVVVEHDTVIGDHCHISAGAVINGDVVIEDRTFIGSQAMIREGITIGARCIIGAGAILLNTILPGTTHRSSKCGS